MGDGSACGAAAAGGVLQIKKTGCNVLLIQKSILRDAYNDLSLHFLAKVGRHEGRRHTTQASCARGGLN